MKNKYKISLLSIQVNQVQEMIDSYFDQLSKELS